MQEQKNTKTEIYSPKCSHMTYTSIRYGEVGIHCKYCSHDFEVIIRLTEGGDEKPEKT